MAHFHSWWKWSIWNAKFEFSEKLGRGYFCFHDRDIAPEGVDLAETNRNLDEIVLLAKKLSEKTGELENFVNERYLSFSIGIGKDIVEGKVGFNEFEKYALENKTIVNKSGWQEMLEGLLNKYILE